MIKWAAREEMWRFSTGLWITARGIEPLVRPAYRQLVRLAEATALPWRTTTLTLYSGVQLSSKQSAGS